METYNEEMKSYSNLVTSVERVRNAYMKNKEYVDNPGLLAKVAGSLGVEAFKTKLQNEFNDAKKDLALSITRDFNGKNSSDTEFRRVADKFETVTLNSGESAFSTIVDNTMGAATRSLNDRLIANPLIVRSPDGAPGKLIGELNPNEGALYGIRQDGKEAEINPTAKMLDEQMVQRNMARFPTGSPMVSKAYDVYAASIDHPNPGTMPGAAQAVDTAAHVMLHSDPGSDDFKAAQAALQQMASGSIGNHNLDHNTVDYAKFTIDVLSHLGNHPNLPGMFNNYREGEGAVKYEGQTDLGEIGRAHV